MSAALQRIDALLLEEASGRLSPEDLLELERLLETEPAVDRCRYQRAAAAVFLAAAPAAAPAMPDALYAKVVAAFERSEQER